MSKRIIAGIAIAVALAGVAFFFSGSESEELHAEIIFGNAKMNVIVAESFRERVLGLSYRESLAPDTVMLFVFDTDGRHGIHMKEMHFGLDIVWLDSAKQIVHIESDVRPESYPKIFQPSADARYVVEMNAGQAAQIGLRIGQTAQFE